MFTFHFTCRGHGSYDKERFCDLILVSQHNLYGSKEKWSLFLGLFGPSSLSSLTSVVKRVKLPERSLSKKF